MHRNDAAELKGIADRLARRSNDPQAMADFNAFVRRISPAARRDLVVVLQEMIEEARKIAEVARG